MQTKLHHYFVPTQANVYQPHLLRWWSLGIIGFGLLALQLLFNLTAAQSSILGFATDVDKATVVSLTNQQRAVTGAEPLTTNTKLDAAAREKAQDMFDGNYWAHVSPSGTEPWDFFDAQNYSYVYAGENLAKNFATSAGVIEGWMNSPGHRANLLSDNYTEIGIATVNGQLEGEDTTLVVALYGRPSGAPPVVAAGERSAPTPAAPIEVTTESPAGSSVLSTNATALTWAQRATLPVIGFIALLYVGQHIIVRRKHMQWDHASHPRPLLQAGVLVGLMVVVILSGQGVVL